jgi:hypothetical protein
VLFLLRIGREGEDADAVVGVDVAVPDFVAEVEMSAVGVVPFSQ